MAASPPPAAATSPPAGLWPPATIIALIGAVIVGVAIPLVVYVTNWCWRDVQQRRDRQDRLTALESKYSQEVQPAAADLDALRQQYPGGSLWQVLMRLNKEEQKARNIVKGFWKQLVGAMERGELPPEFGDAKRGGRVDFKGADGETWAARASNFRLLVEPFDIANYYRLSLNASSGHYLVSDNRPDIYCRLEITALECHRRNSSQKWERGIAWARRALEQTVDAATVMPDPVAEDVVSHVDSQ